MNSTSARRPAWSVGTTVVALLTVAALGAAVPPAAAYSVSAQADVSLSAVGSDGASASENTGTVTALSVALPAIDLQATGTSSRTSASVRANAAIGQLRLFGTYTSDSDPGGMGTGVQINRATVRWDDVATITHDTLPDGEFVTLRAEFDLDGGFSWFSEGNALVNGLVRGGFSGGNAFDSFGFRFDQSIPDPAPTWQVDELLTVRVGDRVPLVGTLEFSFGGDAIAGGFSTATADFENTATANLIAVTPGAGYILDSGATFVPVPPVFGLFGAAVISLLARRRRPARAPTPASA